MNKVILIDCDGVLLDWIKTFRVWAEARGYTWHRNDSYKMSDCLSISDAEADTIIKQFNESAAMMALDQMPGASEWVRAGLSELGYKLRVITSLSTCPFAKQAREYNLARWFGDMIEDVTCLETGADKFDALYPYRASGLWWIEDHPHNANVGHELGLRSILFNHEHNKNDVVYDGIYRVNEWSEIYDIIERNDYAVGLHS